jgi:hypothetical protein
MNFIPGLMSCFNPPPCFLRGYTKNLLSDFERNSSIKNDFNTLIYLFFLFDNRSAE